jgi:nitric oxide reductase subunit B
MSADDISDGKASFQQADLMDYTAEYLNRLGAVTADNIARTRFGQAFSALNPEQQAAARAAMQDALKSVDLTRREVTLPPPVAAAFASVKTEIAEQLLHHDLIKGWTQAYSLDQQSALKTADFILYSALTTVARRPGTDASWTQNWPYEPLVGNTPNTDTFRWTWISFCFRFFCFGMVLFVYHRYLIDPASSAMDPVLAGFGPLTPSQRKVGKYFLVVAAVLLQIAAGAILGHYYADRVSFYGIHFDDVLPFNFWRSVHIQAPIIWIGLSWIGAALFIAPAISGREAAAQGPPVDLLFWATIVIVAGALIGNYLGIMGVIKRTWFWFGNQGLSYIELGRFWQIAFFFGLIFWRVCWCCGRVAEPRDARPGDASVLDWTHPSRTSPVGVDDQYRRALYLRNDPAGQRRPLVHDHGFLALVGCPLTGQAVLRVLRRGDERLSADGAGAGVAAARRARGLFRTDFDSSAG